MFRCKWAPIEFDEVGSLTYLVTRSAAEYASLVGIFKSIQEADPKFQPRTLFDFGSGEYQVGDISSLMSVFIGLCTLCCARCVVRVVGLRTL